MAVIKESNTKTAATHMTRKFEGIVISDKMEKTVVVKVTRTKVHPKYKKRYQVSRKFHAHDPRNEFHKNDLVVIEETRPRAKMKKWRVVKKLN